MAGELVQLPQPGDARGRRYTDQDKEGAYAIWRLAGGRSCRRAAQLLGIAENTLTSWRDAGGWIARANLDDHDDVASIRHGIAAVITHEMPANIEVAKEIRDNRGNDPKVRLAAAQWLAGIGGVASVTRVEQAIVQATQRTSSIVDVTALSDVEIHERESQLGTGR